MKLSLDISVPSPYWRRLRGAREMARATIDACVAESGVRTQEGAEVSLFLADDARVRALNAQWRGLDRPTNVLSFPAAPHEGIEHSRMLGDIALAYETVAREAEESGLRLADHYRHLVAHGFLHLIGFDHETDADANRMEALETRILARLGVSDPYAHGASAP